MKFFDNDQTDVKEAQRSGTESSRANAKTLDARKAEAVASGSGGTGSAGARKSSVGDIEEESVRRRAYEIYQERGGTGGSETEDWLQAEAELREKDSPGEEQSEGRLARKAA